MSEIRKAQRVNPIRAYLPALGLVLGVACAVIAWVLAPSLESWAQRQFPSFNTGDLDPLWITLAFAGFIFLILSSTAAFLVALAVPRPKYKIKDKELSDDRKAMLDEKQAQKRRRQKIREANASSYKSK
jgi:TRAP-type mannitol/chloroaromatic compound transport system permease small subunit